jgi:endonuclease YncB( thermonuclease family)
MFWRLTAPLWASLVLLALATGFGHTRGRVYVVDGDTIHRGGERIRIIGLDAPETRRAKCEAERRLGYLAKARLVEIINSGKMRIRRMGKDRYGRTLARVRVSGRNVADILVKEGYARPYWGGKRMSWCD